MPTQLTLQKIQSFLEEEEIPFETEQLEEGVITFGIEGDRGCYDLAFDLDEVGGILVCFSRSAPELEVAKMVAGSFFEALAIINYGLALGSFQFDSEDPFEVLIDRFSLDEVEDLDLAAYQPRSTTPLYDAVGRMIVRIDGQITSSRTLGLPEEDQVVLIVTDGLENASTEFTLQQVFSMVSERRENGWAFVFLGADESTYKEGEAMGVFSANTARWDATGEGTAAMFSNVSQATSSYRAMGRADRMARSERFLQTDSDDTPWTRRCLQHAQRIVLVANAGEPAPPSAGEAALSSATTRLTEARRILVLLHPENAAQPVGTRRWLASRSPSEHHHVRWRRPADYARLARFLANRAVGLVLGGGGARGFAHFGAYLALREAGVPIDMIGGTSMGAVIGAQCALGWNREKMEEINRNGLIRKQPFKEYTLPLFSLVSSRKLDRVLQNAHGDTEIEDLWLRFFCVSSNLSFNRALVHHSGMLWRALRASSALPGIVLPVVSPEGLLVDGGLVNNLPGDLMREFCRTVIVVNVSSGQDIQQHYGRFPSPWQVALARLMPFRKALRMPTILDVLMGSTMLSSAGRAEQVISEADLCLEPPIEEFGVLEFSKLEELIDIGHRHATERVARWLEERPDPWLADARK